jgi:putative thiamine transport system substrate-binding protein
MLTRRTFLAAFASSVAIAASGPGLAAAMGWDETLRRARGRTVYFNAWGGEPRINDYIAWAGRQTRERFGVELVHVKLADTSTAVSAVLAEKTAGKTEAGSIDLVWINGPSFASMKEKGLLLGPWADGLPNARWLDRKGKPGIASDFTVPVEGYESPWGMAQLVFYADLSALPSPPRSISSLLAWVEANPGRFTYPDASNFLGATFLKQVLIGAAPDAGRLQAAPGADAEAVLAPVWAWLEEARPHLWRKGRAYPADSAALRRLVADREIDIGLSFDPAEAAASVASGELAPGVRVWTLDGGTLGNANFVAIPFNAASPEAAKVVADFLLSPEAQARKLDPAVWGGLTVLDVASLPPEEQKWFAAIDPGPAGLRPEQLGPVLPEPHPGWMTLISTEWRRRYGAS